MRAWMKPGEETIELFDDDSHSTSVAFDPERFGLDSASMKSYLESLDGDFAEFDYDTVIVLAEMAGWVRLARDGNASLVASGADVKLVRKAVRQAADEGAAIVTVQVELERIDASVLHGAYYKLDEDQTDRFLRHGTLPGGRQWRSEVSAPDLAQAQLRHLREACAIRNLESRTAHKA